MAGYSGEMAAIRIPAFRGLWQSGDGIGTDARYAVEGVNALTTEGVLRPMAQCALLDGALPAPIETLARLNRRWHAQAHDVLVAAAGGQLYWMLPGGESWEKMALPPDWEGEGYQSNVWSYVTYEINPEGADAPVDVLLMSNARDGMICVRGDSMAASVVKTPKRFGVIARHAERIWGGAIEDDPDMLAYSAPFDPFNWEQNDESPEDGAGDLKQPSWDGDSFTALTPFGSQLVALKRTRVWRILGTNPGEYVFKEQYGGGTAYAATVAVDGARILMLGRDGLMAYDGESVTAYAQEYARDVFRRMNAAALKEAFACMYRGTYYCALPLDGAERNNAVILYNTREQTWLLRRDIEVEAFLPTEDALYFTSASTPGRVWRWREEEPDAPCERMRWVTPWVDLGSKSLSKGWFTVYMAVACAEPVEVDVSLETEKKIKTRRVRFEPVRAGRQPRQRKLRFGGCGRQFRLVLEGREGAPWRLVGGLQVETEAEGD